MTKKIRNIIIAAISIVAVVILVIIFFPGTVGDNGLMPEEDLNDDSFEIVIIKPYRIIEGAKKALEEAGWSEDDYVLETDENFDPELDQSTGGDGSFDSTGYKYSDEYLWYSIIDPYLAGTKDSYISESSPEKIDAANASIHYISEATGDSLWQIINPENWIAVQSLIPFYYDGNLSYRDGIIVNNGIREGGKGDIFFLYISPTLADEDSDIVDVVAVRAACSNPQKKIPPTKSPNPDDWQKAGEDNKYDSGAGAKTKVTVTKPVESKPTEVVTDNGNESVTDEPGSETTTEAPGASSPTQDTSDDISVDEDSSDNEEGSSDDSSGGTEEIENPF